MMPCPIHRFDHDPEDCVECAKCVLDNEVYLVSTRETIRFDEIDDPEIYAKIYISDEVADAAISGAYVGAFTETGLKIFAMLIRKLTT